MDHLATVFGLDLEVRQRRATRDGLGITLSRVCVPMLSLVLVDKATDQIQLSTE